MMKMIVVARQESIKFSSQVKLTLKLIKTKIMRIRSESSLLIVPVHLIQQLKVILKSHLQLIIFKFRKMASKRLINPLKRISARRRTRNLKMRRLNKKIPIWIWLVKTISWQFKVMKAAQYYEITLLKYWFMILGINLKLNC